MTDTALWVEEGKLGRLPAAYRHGDEGLVEVEPAGGGFYAGPPSFDVSHGQLVSTARDYYRFARCRIGWSGGLGTNFFLDPDGTIGILLTQVQMGAEMSSLVAQFQSLRLRPAMVVRAPATPP